MINACFTNKVGQTITLGDEVAYPRIKRSGMIEFRTGKLVKLVSVIGVFDKQPRSYALIRVKDTGFRITTVCVHRLENIIKVL